MGANNETIVDLNTGEWTFYAMAWSTAPLKGDVACGIESRSFRKYGTETVELSLTNAKCTDDVFAGSDSGVIQDNAGIKSLGSTKVTFCDQISSITGSSQVCSDEPGINPVLRAHKRGHSASFRFSLVSFDASGSSYNFLSDKASTDCVNAVPTDYTGNVATEVPQLPSGKIGTQLPFYVKLESYPGNQNCTDSGHGIREVIFRYGIESADTVTARHTIEAGVPDKHKIFVKMGTDVICQGKSLTQDFAGGLALTQHSPLLICNIDQLYKTSLYGGSSFKLMNHIDLSPYAKGTLNHPSFSVIDAACVQSGSNFRPIGMTNTCLAGGHDFDFYGNDKTITGMKINIPTADYVGFISRKNSGVGSYWDLTFANAYVKGLRYVGVTAGLSQAAARNITVNGAYVQAVDHSAGGLMGEARGGAFSVNVMGANVISANGNAGGIAGTSNTLNEALFSGKVTSGGPSVGGLVGELISGAFVWYSRAEGLVQGLRDVGGLVGLVAGTSFRVQNSYATVAVISTATEANGAGGLIGRLPASKTGSSFFSNSYFFGTVSDACILGDSSCLVGNLVGFAPPAWNIVPDPKLYYATPGVSALLQTDGPPGTAYAPELFLDANTTFTLSDISGAINRKSGHIPRLKFDRDRHFCRENNFSLFSVNDQINTQLRGTSALTPVYLCNTVQITEMQSYPDAKYKLATYIYDFKPQTTSIVDFSGAIDGAGFALIGKEIGDGSANISWWSTVTGEIKDLGLYSPFLRWNAGSPLPGETITQNDAGTITDIEEIDVRSD